MISFCDSNSIMDLRTIQKSLPVITVGYVLQLENEKWYCGISTNVHQRIGQHLVGLGSKWTQLHKPISVQHMEVVPNEFGSWEKSTTLKLMREHGWANVRGGPFCKVHMSGPPSDLYSNFKCENASTPS